MANPFDRFDSQPTANPFDRFDGPEKSADYGKGKTLGSGTQGLFSALQGLTLGFGDEVAGLGGAIAGGIGNAVGTDDGTTFGERYRRTRDAVRGAQDQFMQDRPVLGTATRLAAGAPLVALGGGSPVAAAVPMGIARTTGQAAGIAGALGAVQGAGESTSEGVGGVLSDALAEGAKSAAFGGGANLAVAGIGGAAGAVRRAVSKPAAQDFAKLKVAEALARDARAAPGGIPVMAMDDAAAALKGFGPEGRIADAAGESTRGLLDTMAILPGQTKTLVERAIRDRQAGRGGRLVTAADDALETGGKRFVDELDALAEAKRVESFPLYEQVREVPVRLTKDIKKVLARVPGAAWAEAKKIVKAEQGIDLDVGAMLSGRTPVPLGMLDSVKKGLYEAAQAEKAAGRRGVGSALDEVRKALVTKLDDISPKDDLGKSIYASARETYGGFANLEELLKAGRKAFTDDTFDIAAATKGLNEAQLHSFRIGALQALRQKVGTQSGQTSLLKADIEPGTMERLKVIFGDDATLGKFVSNLMNEGKLKRLESVGRGSPTAPRLAAMADLDLNPAARPEGLREMAANALYNVVGRVRTPEATRDEIGRILLSQGGGGQKELNALRMYLDQVNAARSARASAIGGFAGIAP